MDGPDLKGKARRKATNRRIHKGDECLGENPRQRFRVDKEEV